MKSMALILLTLVSSVVFAQTEEKVDTVAVELGKWQNEQLVNLDKQIAELVKQQQTILMTIFDSNKIVPDRVRGLKLEQGKLIILTTK